VTSAVNIALETTSRRMAGDREVQETIQRCLECARRDGFLFSVPEFYLSRSRQTIKWGFMNTEELARAIGCRNAHSKAVTRIPIDFSTEDE
jgi:hypothetical protein